MRPKSQWHFPVYPWQYELIKRGWRSDPVTLGVITLIIGAGVGGAAMGGAFSGDKGGSNAGAAPAAASPAATDIGNATDVGSIDSQAASRRLARLSKYFTTPTGVLGDNTGAAGIF